MRSIRERGRNALERDEMLSQQLKEEEEERDREREQELANEPRASASFERLGSILSGYFTPQKQTAEREDGNETNERGNGRHSDLQDATFDRSDQALSQSESESESESNADVDNFDDANDQGEESMCYDVSDAHESDEGAVSVEELAQGDNEFYEARDRGSVDEGSHYRAEQSDEGSEEYEQDEEVEEAEESEDAEEKYEQADVSMPNNAQASVVEILSSSDEEGQEEQDNTPEEQSDKGYDDYDNEDFADHEHMEYHEDYREEDYHGVDYEEEDYHEDVEMEEASQEEYPGIENLNEQAQHDNLGVPHLPTSFHELLHEGENGAQQQGFHDQMSHMDPMIIEEGLFVGDGVEYDSYAPVADALLQMRSNHGNNINVEAVSESGNTHLADSLPTDLPADGSKEHLVPADVSEPLNAGNEQTVSELVDKVPEPTGTKEPSLPTEQEAGVDGTDKKDENETTAKKRVDVASLVQHKDIPTFTVSSKKEFNPFYSDESDNEEAVSRIQDITANAFKKLHSLNLNFSFGSSTADSTAQAPPIEKHSDDAHAPETSQSPAPAHSSRQFRPKGLDTPKLPVAAVNYSPIEFIGFSDKALGLAPSDDEDQQGQEQEQELAEESNEILEKDVVQESTTDKGAETETITNGKMVDSTEQEESQKETNDVEPSESQEPTEQEANGGSEDVPDNGPAVQEDADKAEDSIGARVAREHELEAEAHEEPKAEEAEEAEVAEEAEEDVPQSKDEEESEKAEEQEGEEMDVDIDIDTNNNGNNNELDGVDAEKAAPEAAETTEMESESLQEDQKDVQETTEAPVPRRTLRSGKIIGQPEPVEPARKQLRSSSKKPDPIKPARQSARVRQKKKQDADPAEPASEPIDSSSVDPQAVERSEQSPEPSRKRKAKDTKPRPSPKKPKRRRVNLNKK